MHPSIEQALKLIELETAQGEFCQVFDAVHAIVENLGEADLADHLIDAIPQSVPVERVATLFNLLAWQTEDNGSASTRAAERWLLEGRDLRRCSVALSLDVYPFIDEQEMYRVLSSLASTLSQLTHACESLISARQAG
jgi:hypothetical protein